LRASNFARALSISTWCSNAHLPSASTALRIGRQQARVIVAISRGGLYGAGTPAAVGQHLETYLRWVLGFIGVKNPEFISADGIQMGPEHRQKAVASALKAASDLDAA
jgi:FMN-dependent NADH-azoreductase